MRLSKRARALLNAIRRGDLREVEDVLDLFRGLRQVARAGA